MPALRAAALDVAWVLVFAVVGRRSHDEGTGLVGVLSTAWPFLAGYAVGLLFSWRRRPDGLRAGVVSWLCAVVLGIGLRLASGETAQPSFVLVTTTFLAVGLLGWRTVLWSRARANRRRHAGQHA